MTDPPVPVADRLLVGSGRRVLPVAVTWWHPGGPSRGTVWLQHGFARTRRRMAFLADALRAAGCRVITTSLRSADPLRRTVNNFGANGVFLDELARSLGECTSEPLVAVGHSAGGDAAARVAAAWLRAGTPVAGLILLDPVPGPSGGHLRPAVGTLAAAGVGVRIAAAPPSRCNAGGSGLRQVLPQLTGFAGVLLPTGSHVDAEGPATDRWAELACGRVLAANAAAVRDLTVAWATTMAGADPTGPAAASETLLQDLSAAGRVEPLRGTRG